MAERFQVSSTGEGRDVRLRMAGEFDRRSIGAADRCFDDSLFEHPGRGLVVDMCDVTLMDRSGVEMVLGWAARAKTERRTFDVVEVPDLVGQLIRLLGQEATLGVERTAGSPR